MATMVITVIKMSSHTYDDVVKLDEVLDIIKMVNHLRNRKWNTYRRLKG
jgi:hypothetical protein